MSSENNPVMHALQHLNQRFDRNEAQMDDFMRADAAGEAPDPEQFNRLLATRSVTRRAMEAQYKLHEKPLKTVLNEAK
jgi:hypothetical protein